MILKTIKLTISTCFVLAALAGPAAAGRKPNIVFILADDLAVLIEFGDVHRDVAGLAVEFDARAHLGALVGVLEIRDQDGLLDDPDQFFKRNLSLALHEPQHSEVDVHLGLRYSDCARPTLGRIDAV